MSPERGLNPETEYINNIIEVYRPVGVDLYESDLAEAQNRRNLAGKVKNIFNHIPEVSMPAEEALDKGLVNLEDLAETYDDLADFIEQDPNHSRIILYLPLELLPDLKKQTNKPDKLRESEIRLAHSYKNAWIRQLFESGIRAEFNDGDVLEPGLGQPVRVRKAGHLTGEIIKKGIISLEEVNLILEIDKKETELVDSIQEGMEENKGEEEKTIFDWEKLSQELAEVEKKYALGSANDSGQTLKEKYQAGTIPSHKMSRERLMWKRRQQLEKIICKYAKTVTDEETIKQLLETKSKDQVLKIIGLRAIFNQTQNPEKWKKTIQNFWETGNNQIKDTIIGGLSHWQKGGLDIEDYVKNLGVKIPDLSLVYPLDLKYQKEYEFKNLMEAAKKISNNPVLTKNIYPILLAVGSRVKGYAGIDSDQDVAILFKPEADWENRETILTEMRKIPELAELGKICEFWVKENEGKLGIKYIPGDIWGVLGPEQINYIFGGLWLGCPKETEKLRQDLVDRYLNLSNLGDKKDLARFKLLRQLENDVLQCRLLQKGYHKFYPDKIDSKIRNNPNIDGESAFWDPGYRRVATELFLSRVFLPDLS